MTTTLCAGSVISGAERHLVLGNVWLPTLATACWLRQPRGQDRASVTSPVAEQAGGLSELAREFAGAPASPQAGCVHL